MMYWHWCLGVFVSAARSVGDFDLLRYWRMWVDQLAGAWSLVLFIGERLA